MVRAYGLGNTDGSNRTRCVCVFVCGVAGGVHRAKERKLCCVLAAQNEESFVMPKSMARDDERQVKAGLLFFRPCLLGAGFRRDQVWLGELGMRGRSSLVLVIDRAFHSLAPMTTPTG